MPFVCLYVDSYLGFDALSTTRCRFPWEAGSSASVFAASGLVSMRLSPSRLTIFFRLHFCIGLIMASQLKRTGSFDYVAMLVAKSKPHGWQPETLLLRFVEQNGASSMFTVTGDGIGSFDACELFRIYEMPLNGRCVRSSKGANKYGSGTRWRWL